MISLEMLRFYAAPTEQTRDGATPTAVYESVLDLDFELFFKGMYLISDWDGTWAPHNRLPGQAEQKKLEEAVKYCRTVSVMSNCSAAREEQMRNFLEPLGVNFFRAQPPKPSLEAFTRVFQALGLTPADIRDNGAYVGDRRWSDVLGANEAGFRYVLQVRPLSGNDPLGVRIARALENWRYR